MPVAVGLVFLIRLLPLGEETETNFVADGELRGRKLDLLVGLLALALTQGADQNFHVALGLLLLGLGEEHARFDVHEMGGHGDEFAGDFHVHALALVEPGEVLL